MSDELRTFLERMAGEVRWEDDVPSRMVRRARWRRARTVAVGLLTTSVLVYGGLTAVRSLSVPPPGPAGSGECSWRVIPSPNQSPEGFANRLQALAVIADDDVWAVGDRFEPGEGGEVHPLTMHWDGEAWSIVPLPAEVSSASLTDVAASSSDDVWIVGFEESGDEEGSAVALRWDGQGWTVVPLADPGARFHHLTGVSAISSTQAWAVGGSATGSSGSPLAQRWDGERWSLVTMADAEPRPRTALPYSGFEAVDVLSENDAWAVGYTTNVAPVGPSNTLIQHWGGERWTVVPSPDVRAEDGLPYNTLFSVSAVSPADAWAVGSYASEPGYGGSDDRALIERWDGIAWTLSEAPGLSGPNRLSGVVAFQAGEAWAVGSTGDPGSYGLLVLRWNGTGWRSVPTPVEAGSLADVAVSPGGDIWAVGSRGEGDRSSTLVLVCDRSD